MKRVIKLIISGITVSVFAAVTLFGCSDSSDPVSDNGGNGKTGFASAKISITAAAPFFKDIADSAVVLVSGEGMDDIIAELEISGAAVSGTVADIPVGTARSFEVSVYDDAGTLQYYGKTVTDITGDAVTEIAITLTRITGSADINGSVTEVILFFSMKLGDDYSKYRSDINGEHITKLDSETGGLLMPSNDGSRLAFVSGRASERNDIWLMDIDGGSQAQVTSNSGEDYAQRWSSDDSKIAFSAFRPYGTPARVMIINADGTGERELYSISGYDLQAVGFADGDSRVLFFKTASAGNSDCYLMSIGVDGSSLTEIVNLKDTLGAGTVYYKSGMIDRSRETIVFAFHAGEGIWGVPYNLYRMNVDGTGITKLVERANLPYIASNDKIVYMKNNDTTNLGEIWIMELDGSNKTQILAEETTWYSYPSLISM